jgi:hypothetical protein
MAVSAKAQVKKILSSKSFTGKQAAHLILKDSVEVDNGRPGLLTPTDIQRLKQGLQGREVDVYNSWIRAYQLVDYSVKEATIMALQAKGRFLATTGVLFERFTQELAHEDAEEKPQVVTQKQLEDIQRELREEAQSSLEDFFSVVVNSSSGVLEEVIRKRPDVPEDVIQDALHYTVEDMEDIEGLTPEQTRALQDEIFRASALRLVELAEAGRLTPFTLTKAELGKKEKLRAAFQERSREDLAEAIGSREWTASKAYGIEVCLRAFKRATPEKTAALVKRIRTAIEDGSLVYEGEHPEWIESVFFRGQNLIEAELPWYSQEGLDPSVNSSFGYAVLVDPRPHQLDEKGHYRPRKGFLNLGTPEGVERLEQNAQEIRDTITIVHRDIRKQIRHFLGFRAVIEAVSESIGVNLGERIEAAHEDLTSTVEIHHEMLKLASTTPRLKDLANLRLDIEALKPSQKTVDYIRERLAMSLGQGWWMDVATALNDELEASDA